MASSDVESTAIGRSAGEVVGVVLDPQSYRNLLYLVLAFPLGLAYFLLLTLGFALGAGLAVLLVGVPILVATVVVTRRLADFERTLANALLDVDIHPPDDDAPDPAEGLWATFRRYIRSESTWTGVVFLYLKFWLGLASLVLITLTVGLTVGLVTAPLHYDNPAFGIQLGPGAIDTLPEALAAVPFGLVFGVVSLHALNRAAGISGQVAVRLLGADGPSPDESAA